MIWYELISLNRFNFQSSNVSHISGSCKLNADCASDWQSCENGVCVGTRISMQSKTLFNSIYILSIRWLDNDVALHFLVKPYTCLLGICSSMFGSSIRGNKDSVARACAMDPRCKAFRYSSQDGFGFLCDNLDRRQGHGDWKVCGFRQGKLNM